MTYFRRRVSPVKPEDPIDYKDVDLLRKFITERGKILPRRITGLTAKQQDGAHCQPEILQGFPSPLKYGGTR